MNPGYRHKRERVPAHPLVRAMFLVTLASMIAGIWLADWRIPASAMVALLIVTLLTPEPKPKDDE